MLCWGDGKCSNTDAFGIEDGNAPMNQVGLNGRKIEQQQSGLLCRNVWASPKKYDRRCRLLPQNKQSSKIGICRDDNTILPGSQNENLGITRKLEIYFSDMQSAMPCLYKLACHLRGKLVVNEKPHEAFNKGSIRSRTAAAA